MSDIDLTPEETEALSAMEADTGEMTEAPMETTPEAPVEVKAEETPAEAPEAEEKPAETPEFKSSRAPEKPPEGFVPHQAMHAERVKRQELEKKIEELQAQMAPKEEAPQYADPILDPEGYRKWAEHQAAQPNAAIEQMQKQQQEQAQRNETMQRVSGYEAQFRANNPDYDEAAKFMMTARVSELRGQGYGDAEINQFVQNDVLALVEAGEKAGVNPAQLAYMRASEMGYQKPAPEPVKPDTTEATQKIEAAAHAQKQTQGANGAGGGGGSITAAQLADMSEAELAKLSTEDFAKAMGG